MGVVLMKWAWSKIFCARFARITATTRYPTIVIILDPPLCSMDVGATGGYVAPEYVHVRICRLHASYSTNTQPVLRL